VAQEVQLAVRLLRQVVVRHQQQSTQEQHQLTVRQVHLWRLAVVEQVVRLIMQVLVLLVVMVAYRAVVVEVVVVELPLVVQVVMEQQER
jgi:hypothetical protein